MNLYHKWNSSLFILVVAFLSSCASKKDIILFQNLEENISKEVVYAARKIQVNDILNITISTANPESAAPYNIGEGAVGANNIEIMKLQGYLVSDKGTVTMPILGIVVVSDRTIEDLELQIKSVLEDDGHLINPTVSVRLLNAKVTVLGEVNKPGTYSYTEQFITLPQALGYAGGVTLGANRKNIVLIREEEGTRKYYQIDLTQSDWFNTPAYTIKQNDIIYVSENVVTVKSAGFVGNVSTALSVASILLTSFVLLTR